MSNASRRVGPAHPGAQTPEQPFAGAVPHAAQGTNRTAPPTGALRQVMLSLRHVVPGLHWDARPSSAGPSGSHLNPVTCWQDGHLRRLHTTAALALLVVLASGAGVQLSLVTIQPPIPPGSGVRYVQSTLKLLRQLTRHVRELSRHRGFWGRIVGTINVAITGAGTASWSALPHAHMVIPTALVDSVQAWWSAACSDLTLPDTPARATRPAVHSVALGTSPEDIARVSLYMQQHTWTRRTDRPGQPLAVVAREGGELADRGAARGIAMLRQWARTVGAIQMSGVALGLGRVTHRGLAQDAREVVRILELEGQTTSGDQVRVAERVLNLLPHYRADEGGLPAAIARLLDRQQSGEPPASHTQAQLSGPGERRSSETLPCTQATVTAANWRLPGRERVPHLVISAGISWAQRVHPEEASASSNFLEQVECSESAPPEPCARSPPAHRKLPSDSVALAPAVAATRRGRGMLKMCWVTWKQVTVDTQIPSNIGEGSAMQVDRNTTTTAEERAEAAARDLSDRGQAVTARSVREAAGVRMTVAVAVARAWREAESEHERVEVPPAPDDVRARVEAIWRDSYLSAVAMVSPERERLATEASSLRDEVDALTAAVESVEGERDALADAVAEARQKREDADARAERAEQNAREQASRISAVQEERDRLASQVAALIARIPTVEGDR